MSFLQIEQLAKSFRRQAAIRDLSLSVAPLETLVIFGPSGAGKTVLLRLIAGMIPPDAGRILVGGRDITDLPPERRELGMAFQNFALYPHMTAYENIASPLRARRTGEKELDQRVHEVARLLRIDHVLSHLPRALSNGQKQRTALARSLVSRPHLILLDDPLRNVDAKVRYEMRLELPRVLRARETTVIYVTQDYKEAMALGDRIAVLVEGRIEQIDTPRAIYERPANSRIARLFGDPPINLLAVQAASPGHIRLATTDFTLDQGAPSAAGVPVGALLGLRPEDVAISFEPVAGGMPVEIDAVTPLNDREVMLLRAADGTEIFASAPQGEALESLRGRQEAWARLDLARAHFFDAASGARL